MDNKAMESMIEGYLDRRLHIYKRLHLPSLDDAAISDYRKLLERGPAVEIANKIYNDTKRTFKSIGNSFTVRVPEDRLTRLLNASAHFRQDHKEADLYVQGMNVYAAIFLYSLNEVAAFSAYNRFCLSVCPTYVKSNLEGVHAGCGILDRLACDVIGQHPAYSDLIGTLKKHKLLGSYEAVVTWAFPQIMSFGAATRLEDVRGFEEVLKLWDVLLEYGFHLNLLVLIARLIHMEPEIKAAAGAGGATKTRIMTLIGPTKLGEFNMIELMPTVRRLYSLVVDQAPDMLEVMIGHLFSVDSGCNDFLPPHLHRK